MIFFKWDESKNQQNRKKHSIWFEEAKTVFEDTFARVFYDEEHSKREDRFLIIGESCFKKVLIVIHCYDEEDQLVRLISARQASTKERKAYEERV